MLFSCPRIGLFCGADGSRTRDLMLAEHALYQLSYDPFFSAAKIKKILIPRSTLTAFIALTVNRWTQACEILEKTTERSLIFKAQ